MAQPGKSDISQTMTERQELKLLPLQVRHARMLEMTAPELEAAIEKELEANPALERVDVEADSSITEEGVPFRETADDIIRADYSSSDDIPSYLLNTAPNSEKSAVYDFADNTESLYDFLISQINERSLPPEVRRCAVYIVGALDSNGYLHRTASAMVDDIAFSEGVELQLSDMQKAMEVVRSLEPAGVGASGLQDSLMLQLSRRRQDESVGDALKIVESCFDALSKKHYHKIISALKISQNRLDKALGVITSLNPKPGASIGNSRSDVSSHVSPDFEVSVADDGTISVNMYGAIPELTIGQSFSKAVKSMKSDVSTAAVQRKSGEYAYIVERYNEADSFISLLRKRTSTMLSVMGAIVSLQRDYFLSRGDDRRIKPMVLKDVAELAQCDVSTASRATAGKYVSTDWGILPLRHFFSEGLANDVSAREVQAAIRALVEKEDKRHPLSDDSLCELLKKQGYDVSRRTVAKYRASMNLQVARLRKST